MYTPKLDPLAAPGEISKILHEFAWETTALGPIAQWPPQLTTAVGILLNAQFPMLLWWGEESIQLYNDAYAQSIGSQHHPQVFGPPARACWGELWGIIGPQIEHVLAGRGSTYEEDQHFPIMRNGRREDIYLTYCFCPVHGDGKVDGVLAICTDVTQQHHDIARSQNLSAGLLQLFEHGPNFVAVLRGPEHIFQFVNDGYKALMGDRDFIGRPVRQAVPEVEGQGFFELLDEVYRSGKPFTSDAIPMRYQPAPGAPMANVILRLSYQALVGPDGAIFGIYVDGRPVVSSPVDNAREATAALMDAELSPREVEVLRWTAAGKTAAEIATILEISVRTVEFHITSAARKLDTVNRVQTVVEAIKQNLIVV